MKNVTSNTRAGKGGKEIVCPKCHAASRVYHFAWSATVCLSCKAPVEKNEWLINS